MQYKSEHKVETIQMTLDEYLASPYARLGVYPLENVAGRVVIYSPEVNIWLPEDEFNFIFTEVKDNKFMTLPQALSELARVPYIRRQDWPDDMFLRILLGRFMTVTIRRAQRLLAPYNINLDDAVASDWVAVKVLPGAAANASGDVAK